DDARNLRETAQFLNQIGLREVNLLPFHRLGSSKYGQLSREYEFAETASLTQQQLSAMKDHFETLNIHCYIGSDTPF
ncbi:TPA: hypothetical protein N2G33_004588, partial [Salmonella enterica]|nr:hypothetical protein [Salmonella enterica]